MNVVMTEHGGLIEVAGHCGRRHLHSGRADRVADPGFFCQRGYYDSTAGSIERWLKVQIIVYDDRGVMRKGLLVVDVTALNRIHQ